MSSYNSKRIVCCKQFYLCNLRDTSYENSYLNKLTKVVAEEDIVHYYFVDLLPRLKVFMGLYKSKIYISPCLLGSKNLAIFRGFLNVFIFY